MAVKRITHIERFMGESGDTKPTLGVSAGSIFYEEDTRSTYFYNGSAWSPM